MTDKNQGNGGHVNNGYQPRAERPLNPAVLKPPRGGSAIQPPKAPAPRDSK